MDRCSVCGHGKHPHVDMRCFENMRMDIRDLRAENARLVAGLIDLREAIDRIYNHNEAARAAVIALYGLHHAQWIAELRLAQGTLSESEPKGSP